MPSRIVSILGPTGTGKTESALALSEALDVGVVNFDSRQVYGDFPIITAQPTPEEQERCPHLLYGMLGPDRKINAAGFADLAGKAVADLEGQGLLPVLVGGTGLYLKTLLQGIAPIPDIPSEIRQRVLERIKNQGPQVLHRELETTDPEYAARIHPNDTQRNARAAEVYEATGRSMTWWHNRKLPETPFDCLKIGISIDLDELTPRLAGRVDKMLEAGALEEARKAWERYPDPDIPGWTGIGCAELLSHLRGEISLEKARQLWIQNTRAYAKRQITWFKKEEDMHWFSPGDFRGIVGRVREWL